MIFIPLGWQKGTSDPRGQMIYEFLRFLEALKPVYFVMENVSGLKSIDGGGLITEIVKRMEDLGYNVSHGLICAADYGSAQLRRRYFSSVSANHIPTCQCRQPHMEQ